ncbi:MAG: glutaredoxin family protein [Chloroflexi bacterium]|nr:glutaredoxin family protein [Chloroflexota bacterium]
MAHKIKIYTTPACSHCKEAKKYFAERGLDFEELDVAADAKARVEMFGIARTRSVPVIVVDGQVFVGFEENLPKIEQIIG